MALSSFMGGGRVDGKGGRGGIGILVSADVVSGKTPSLGKRGGLVTLVAGATQSAQGREDTCVVWSSLTHLSCSRNVWAKRA